MTTPITRPQGGGSYMKKPDGTLLQVEAPGMDEKARQAAEANAAALRREAAKTAQKAEEKAAAQLIGGANAESKE